MHSNSAVSFPFFRTHEEFQFWIINGKNHNTLHLNQMSSMRLYNSCNYNFTVLPMFTIEEENKESQPSWYAESWSS